MLAKPNTVTLEDVAKLAGVSRATVSRVVRGETGVSKAKQETVNKAIKELGYIPNLMARSLVTRKTDLIAIVVPETSQKIFSDPFFASSVQGILAGLKGTKIAPVMIVGDENGQIDHVAKFLQNGHVDGAVVVSHHRHPEQMNQLWQSPVPIVFVGRPTIDLDEAVPRKDVGWADVNNQDGGYKAAEYLWNLGVRKPAIITGPMDMNASYLRWRGFTLFFEGKETKVIEASGDFTVQSGADAMRNLLHRSLTSNSESDKRTSQRVKTVNKDNLLFDGVFVCSDLMSKGALQVLAEQKLSVPEDLKLISFDNSTIATQVTPKLTTITNPANETSEQAVRILCGLIEGQDVEPVVELPVEIICRETS